MKRTLLIVLLGVFMVSIGCTKIHSAKDVPRITKNELKAKLGSPDLVLIDVRTESDWKMSDEKITGALRMDPESLDTWIGTLPKDKEIVLYCAWPHEGTSARVAAKLIEKGYNAKVLKGGWREWSAAKYPVEKK